MAPADRSNHMFNKQCKLASAFLMLGFTVFSTAYHFRSQLAPLKTRVYTSALNTGGLLHLLGL